MNKTLLACALALAGIGSAHAAKITPVNINAPGVGLNDTAAATPIGRNPGTTVGEQRRIAYQFAADLWGAVLQSNVEIMVEAQFTALACTAASGTLGSAGTKSIFGGFNNATAETWYGGALANAISGEDQDDTDNDIRSNFNANLGGTNPDGTPCLTGSGWYYGLDGNTPTGQTNFLDVVMHEIAHGLNFQGFYNITTGAVPSSTQPTWGDVYSNNVYDNASARTWRSMSNAQRANAAIGESLVWTGANVTAQVPAALGPLIRLNASGALTASYDFGTAGFGAPASTANFAGAAELASDGSANPSQACGALTNAAAIAGKIAVVDRGTCGFTVKVKNAQDAGATGVIVVNNAAGAAPGLGGADATVVIPALGLSQADGTALKAALPGVNIALTQIPGQFAGSDTQGRARLYAPATRAPGSTFSHYDISLTPNALQEPNISGDLDSNFRVDLNPAVFADLGWTLTRGYATVRDGRCNTGIRAVVAPGLLPGANISAADSLCRTANPGNRAAYQSCIAPFVSALQSAGLIPNTPLTRLRNCLK
ncbi:MAG: PA domain-containing protein [Luteimonas sp.]